MAKNGDIVDQLDRILLGIEKEAAAEERAGGNPLKEKKKKDPKKAQDNLGVEQASAAVESGSTADNSDTSTATDTSKEEFAEDDPKTLLAGEKATATPVKKEAIGDNQKIASMEKLGNALLATMADAMQDKQVEVQKQAAEPVVEPTLGDVLFQKCAEEAAVEAQNCFNSFLAGRLQRVQDEIELRSADIDPVLLQKVGGVSGWLDKVAAADETAILPEGVLPEDAGVEPVMDAGAELGPEAGADAGGEIPPDQMEQFVQFLDEKGITAEDLGKAFEDLKALEEAGVSPEDLIAALQGGGGGDPAAEAVAGDAGGAEDTGVPEELAAAEQKQASDNVAGLRGLIKEYLKR